MNNRCSILTKGLHSTSPVKALESIDRELVCCRWPQFWIDDAHQLIIHWLKSSLLMSIFTQYSGWTRWRTSALFVSNVISQQGLSEVHKASSSSLSTAVMVNPLWWQPYTTPSWLNNNNVITIQIPNPCRRDWVSILQVCSFDPLPLRALLPQTAFPAKC